MRRKLIIILGMILLIGGGLWYFLGRTPNTTIEKILENPKAFEGKVVTIEGEVTDRTSFFVGIHFYKVKDQTGEIIVVAKRALPEIKSQLVIKGKIDHSFPLGNEKLVVFMEESIEERGKGI